MKIAKIDLEKIKYLNAFERFTKVRTIECFKFNGTVVFIINPMLLKIILTRKKRIHELSKFLNKPVKVLAIPFKKNKESIEKFINALIAPKKIKSIQLYDSKIVIYAGISRSHLFGKEKKNLVLLKEIFNRYFDIKEIEIK